MVRSIFRGWGVAASGDGGRCELSLRRRFAYDRLHLASRRRGRGRGSQSQNLTQVFFRAAELKGIRPQRSAEPKMIPLPRYAHPQDTAIDAALARSEGAAGAPGPSCCCATLPKLPTAFEALQPGRLMICQTVDLLVGAGGLELPRPLGQQILSRATFASNYPGARSGREAIKKLAHHAAVCRLDI
jgi:hypothetical protein